MATSASTVGLPEDKAYIAHHFNCPTCIAAGRSAGKQARCAAGVQLWDAYRAVIRARIRAERAAAATNSERMR